MHKNKVHKNKVHENKVHKNKVQLIDHSLKVVEQKIVRETPKVICWGKRRG